MAKLVDTMDLIGLSPLYLLLLMVGQVTRMLYLPTFIEFERVRRNGLILLFLESRVLARILFFQRGGRHKQGNLSWKLCASPCLVFGRSHLSLPNTVMGTNGTLFYSIIRSPLNHLKEAFPHLLDRWWTKIWLSSSPSLDRPPFSATLSCWNWLRRNLILFFSFHLRLRVFVARARAGGLG